MSESDLEGVFHNDYLLPIHKIVNTCLKGGVRLLGLHRSGKWGSGVRCLNAVAVDAALFKVYLKTKIPHMAISSSTIDGINRQCAYSFIAPFK